MKTSTQAGKRIPAFGDAPRISRSIKMATFSVEVRYRTSSGCNTKLFPCIEAIGFSEAIEIATGRMRKRRGVVKIDGGHAVKVSE